MVGCRLVAPTVLSISAVVGGNVVSSVALVVLDGDSCSVVIVSFTVYMVLVPVFVDDVPMSVLMMSVLICVTSWKVISDTRLSVLVMSMLPLVVPPSVVMEDCVDPTLLCITVISVAINPGVLSSTVTLLVIDPGVLSSAGLETFV